MLKENDLTITETRDKTSCTAYRKGEYEENESKGGLGLKLAPQTNELL